MHRTMLNLFKSSTHYSGKQYHTVQRKIDDIAPLLLRKIQLDAMHLFSSSLSTKEGAKELRTLRFLVKNVAYISILPSLYVVIP